MSGDDAEQVHDGKAIIGEIVTRDGPEDAGVPTVRFVHYPGSQQLILWLPRPGYQGYKELSVTRDGGDVERGPVSGRLNGGVQILFDTLRWPPGDYLISISHDEGWRHAVRLTKFAPGVEPAAPPSPELANLHPPQRDSSGEIIYRDGFGEVIPNADLDLRAGATRDLARKFARRLEYEGSFRGGVIIYLDGERRIAFSHEMCGGDMKFSIDIPAADRWEAATGSPLFVRDEIVAFVAERVKQDKASGWRYEITPRSIDFY